MNIKNTVFTFQIWNKFEDWSKIFDNPEIDVFHKTVGLSSLYRGKYLTYPKGVILIHHAEEGVAKHIFSDQKPITNKEEGGHIYSTTKIASWLSD